MKRAVKPAQPIALPERAGRNTIFAGARSLNVEDLEYASVTRARVRIALGLACFLIFLFLLITRLAEVSIFRVPSNFNGLADADVKARSDIVDRNGELLATTVETYSLFADSRKVWDVEASSRAIVSVFPDLNLEIVKARLGSGKAFVWIKRSLTPRERQDVFALGLPELDFQVERQRVYPRGALAAHVLGFTDIDMNGVAGAEKAFEVELSASDAPRKALSIDMRVQFALDDVLRNGREKFLADAASGVVLNIKTGEILALGSFPDYDPNQSSLALPQNRLNRASMSVYELGSTFKPITMALALEEGVLKDGEKLPVHRPFTIQKKLIRDDHPSRVPLGIFDILAESSNRGSTLMALRAGADAQQELLRGLGLFDRVPFELHESAAPILPGEWQDITTATVSYGHGISVTPLALAAAIATLLNGGEYIAPTLEPRVDGETIQKRRVIKPETSQKLVDLMRFVVTNGTGRNAKVEGYALMGKTGSADKLVDGAYDTTRLVTSFAGAFPYSDPNYLVFVVYDEPKAIQGTYGYATAGWNAAKAVGEIVERIAPMLGVEKEGKTAQSKYASRSRR